MILAPNLPPQSNGNNGTVFVMLKTINNMIRMGRFIIIVFFLLQTSFVWAQVTVEVSSKIEVISGKPYYIHEVKRGQTLYSISKAYKVEIAEIESANPEAKQGLKTGQILKIPAKDYIAPQNITEDTGPIEIAVHIVQRGESLSSIASKYGTSLEQLRKLNPGISDNIIPGQSINVPVKATVEIDEGLIKHTVTKGETLYKIAAKYHITVTQIRMLNPGITDILSEGQIVIVGENGKIQAPIYSCENPIKPDVFKIAILIPLYLENAGRIVYDKENRDENIYTFHKPFRYIQFYEGFLMAADSAKARGMNVEIYVFDVDETPAKINKVLANPELAEMHLIIGPFFESLLDTINLFSLEHQIPMVSCILNDRISLNEPNPLFFSAITSIHDQMGGLCTYLFQKEQNSNIIISYQDKESEKLAALVLDSCLRRDSSGSRIILSNYTAEGMNGISRALVKGRKNIVISLSTGDIFLGNFLRNLNTYKESFDITLFGLPGWLEYENIDLGFANNLNTHFFASGFIDYSRDDVRHFVRAFQQRYEADANRDALLGFDVGLYFMSALNRYGTGFYNCYDNISTVTLQSTFDFKKTDSGFYNVGLNIFRMEDYQLWKVDF